jgi:hypothetical protein
MSSWSAGPSTQDHPRWGQLVLVTSSLYPCRLTLERPVAHLWGFSHVSGMALPFLPICPGRDHYPKQCEVQCHWIPHSITLYMVTQFISKKVRPVQDALDLSWTLSTQSCHLEGTLEDLSAGYTSTLGPYMVLCLQLIKDTDPRTQGWNEMTKALLFIILNLPPHPPASEVLFP